MDSNRFVCLRRPWSRQAKQQESCSELCASPQRYPQRSDRSLFERQLLARRQVGESTLTSNEQSVSGKDGLILAVFEQVTNAVLGVARSVESLDLDASDIEGLAVCGCLGHFCAILSANDGQRVCFELD